MKKCISFLLVIILLLTLAPAALALDAPEPVQDFLSQSPFSSDEASSWSLQGIAGYLWELVRDQFRAPFVLLAGLILSMGLGALAYTFAPGQGSNTLLETILLLCLFLQGAPPLLELMDKISQRLNLWSDYLASFVPVFSGVMVSCGQTATAAVYSGMFLSVAFFTSQMIVQVGLPLLRSFLALTTASGVCRMGGIGEACQILLKAIKWIIRLSSMLFGAVLGLQTMLTQSADSLAMQTGKFLLGSGIPLVGQTASSALGSVLAGLRVLKSSLGFAAIAFVGVSFLPLLIECLLFGLIFGLGASAAQAMEYPFCAKMLTGMGQTAELCTALLVFFFMLIVLSTSFMVLSGGGFT